MEPPRGFEPRTYALRVRCSTPELRRLALGLTFRQTPKGRSSLAEKRYGELSGPNGPTSLRKHEIFARIVNLRIPEHLNGRVAMLAPTPAKYVC